MNIFVASDENYVPHLKTLMVSIGENNKKVDSIIVYILDNGISKESKAAIEDLCQKYNSLQTKFLKVSESDISNRLGENVARDRSLATFARIFIPELIDDDKALYFDVDAIVLDDLSELYNIDIENFAIAGVMDTNPVKRHLNVGIPKGGIYINAGMILWNLKKCREINFTQKCIDFVKQYNGQIDAMDQGTINGAISNLGLIKTIHPKFNVLTSMYQLSHNDILSFYQLSDYYTDAELSEAKENPVFVHFTPNMTPRPWVKNCKHPLKNEYWKYRANISYSQAQLQSDNRSLKLKILGWIFRNLPISVFNTIAKTKKK